MEVIEAVIKDDASELASLIEDGQHVSCTDSYGNTALHFASSPAILRQLIAASSDLNVQNKEGDTPLHCWCQLHMKSPNFVFDFEKRKPLMQMLIEAGADCNIQNKFGYTLLHTVFIYGGSAGHVLTENQTNELLELLVANGNADVNKADFELQLPIHHAVCEPYFHPVKALLEWGSDVNARNIWGGTPLHLLSTSDEEDMIRLLLRNGADPSIQDNYGMTCLHEASGMNSVAFMALIIDHDNDFRAQGKHETEIPLVDIRDVNGATALHLAAVYKSIEATELLLGCGAQINIVDDYDSTSLHYGAFGGTVEIVTMLVESGADVNTTDIIGLTPLQVALKRNYHETASAIQRAAKSLENISQRQFENENSEVEKSFPVDNLFYTYVLRENINSNPFDTSHVSPNIFKELSFMFNGDFEGYLKEMAKINGVGMIPENEEVVQIANEVEIFVTKVAACIGEIDQRFKGSILQSGSWYEGTKVGDPNEFDFMMSLTVFQKESTVVIKDNQIDDIQVNRNETSSHLTEQFFKEGKLQSDLLMEKFVSLAKQALCKLGYQTGCKNLKLEGITGHTLIENTWVLQGTTTCDLKFTWTGPRYKGFIITTDLVPTIFVPKWPSFANCSLITEKLVAGNCGCHIVSKKGKWRLSFSLAEKMVFSRLPTGVKQAYVCAKIALHPAASTSFFAVDRENDVESGGCSLNEEENLDEEYYAGPEINEREDEVIRNEVKEIGNQDSDNVSEVFQIRPERRGSEESSKEEVNNLEHVGAEYPRGIDVNKSKEHYDIKEDFGETVNPGGINKEEMPITLEQSSSNFNPNKANLLEEVCCRKSDGMKENRSTCLEEEKCDEKDSMLDGVKVEMVRNSLSLSDAATATLKLEESSASRTVLEEIKEGDVITLTFRNNESLQPLPLDARSLIPSYLLKLVLFKCLDKYEDKQEDYERITTFMVFDELKRCLEGNEPVPYFFCKECDFLSKVITSEGKRCNIAFIVSFLCTLFEMNMS